MKNYFFTSESVTEGHPDKVADLISDNVANYLINQNESYRAAIETMVSSNMVTIAGEVKTSLIDNTDLIEKLSKAQKFKNLCYFSDAAIHRRDPQEYVLRFFAFLDGYKGFESKLGVVKFLDKYY